MSKYAKLISLVGLLAGNAAAGALQSSIKGSEFIPMAKVSLENARAAALKVRPGKITDEELEKEGGGSGLRYSFDILSQGKTYEVGVDARTGVVLENSREGTNPD